MPVFSSLAGLPAIAVIGVGQLVSLVGTGMTTFALTIWLWQTTGQATTLALLAAFSWGPLFLLTPLAGALVDRVDRKLVMMVSDLGAGLGTATILVLLFLDRLEVPYLYAISAFSGACQAFQVPAYGAAVTMMVAKKHYARASGMLSLPQSVSLIAAPALAGILIGHIGLRGIVMLDLLTFGFAVATLAVIRIPPPPASDAGRSSPSGLLAEMLFGWRYIRARKSLLGLLATPFVFNFTFMLSICVLPAMVLARTGNDEVILGTVQSLLGLGSLAGGVAISVWGGPRRRIHGVLLGYLATSLAGGILMGLSRGPWGWNLAIFCAALVMPISAGCNQAIWQAKVPPDVQGRVFGIRRLLAQTSALPAFVLAGPLADRVFEPALMPGGAWVAVFGDVVGIGPGAGVALMFVLSGLVGSLVVLAAYGVAAIRQVEDLLPDHSVAAAPGPERPAAVLDGDDDVLQPHWRSTS